MFIITNLVAIIFIIIGRDRNKLVMSLIGSAILSAIVVLSSQYPVPFLSILVIFAFLFGTCFVSFFVADKIDPDSNIMYVIYWEVVYTIISMFARMIFKI